MYGRKPEKLHETGPPGNLPVSRRASPPLGYCHIWSDSVRFCQLQSDSVICRTGHIHTSHATAPDIMLYGTKCHSHRMPPYGPQLAHYSSNGFGAENDPAVDSGRILPDGSAPRKQRTHTTLDRFRGKSSWHMRGRSSHSHQTAPGECRSGRTPHVLAK